MVKGKLTLSFITYSEISKLESNERIKRIIDSILRGSIVILQGRLQATEESSLIQTTMALVGRIKNFKGVELAVINPNESNGYLDRFRSGIAKALVGERDSLTIIGPASVVKDIKKDPKKIELMLKK